MKVKIKADLIIDFFFAIYSKYLKIDYEIWFVLKINYVSGLRILLD